MPEQQPAQAPNYQSPEVEHPRNISVANSGPKCLAPESAWLETVPFYVLQPNVRSQLGDLLAEELSFTICKTCYASQIAPHSNLAANFIPLQTPPPESSSMNLLVYKEAYCNGSIPRNRQVLYQCASQNSLRPLSDWAQQKAALPGCNGSDVSFEQGRWEASKAGDTAMCGTCYELFVRGTPFERHFSFTAGSHNPDYNWQCDVGRDGIISRVLVQEVLSPSPDYKRWSSITKTWCELPRCPGDGVALKESGSSLAYVAQDGNIGIFCRGCYQDHMAGTVFEGIAKEVELTEEQLTTIPCNLGGAHAKFAMKRAIKRGDFKIWSNSASLNGKVPKCVGLIGVGEAELRTAQEFSWYKLRDHPSIEVCPSCYHICLELFGLDHLFDPIDRPLIGGRVRQCFMPLVVEDANTSLDEPYDFASTLAWRGKMLRDGVAYYYDTDGDLSIFNGYAERVASMPPPCFANSRSSLSPNERKWFGRGANRDDPNDFNFSMCEECFTNCVKGTSIENMVNGDATVAVNKLPGGFVCNAYSNRSRKILKEAAAAGNWEHFAQHWRKREEIRTRFLAAKQREAVQLKKALLLQAQVEAEGARLQINLMQSLTANTNATIMGIGGSVAEAAAPDYGQRYGNSSVSCVPPETRFKVQHTDSTGWLWLSYSQRRERGHESAAGNTIRLADAGQGRPAVGKLWRHYDRQFCDCSDC